MSGHQVGQTKVFLKSEHCDQLAEALARVERAAVLLQRSKSGRVKPPV